MQPCLETFLWHGFSNNLLWSPQRFSQLEQAWKSLVFCRKLINLWAEEPGGHFDLWVLDVFSGWGKGRTHWPQQEFPQLHTGDFVWSIKNQSHRITHWVGTLNLTQSHPFHSPGGSDFDFQIDYHHTCPHFQMLGGMFSTELFPDCPEMWLVHAGGIWRCHWDPKGMSWISSLENQHIPGYCWILSRPLMPFCILTWIKNGWESSDTMLW